MRTVVCIKQILDPEIPPRQFAIDPVVKDAVRGQIPLVIGPFDLNALEVALQVKDGAGGSVTAITLGPSEAKDALRRALAMGCDDAVLITDPALARPDPAQAARALAAAVRKLGGVDLVLCGRQSGDWDFGQVGARLAEELGLPCVALVSRLTAASAALRARQEGARGAVVVEAVPPVVMTVTNSDANQPRMPKVKDRMLAGRKPVQEWGAADLGLPAGQLGEEGREIEVLDLFIPPSERACEMVEGTTGAEKGAALARRLRDMKVL